MDSDLAATARGPVEPPTSAHRVIGILNLIFGGLMLLCGACTAANFVLQAAMAPMTESMQKSMQQSMNAQMKVEHEKKLADLQEQVQAATDEDERARLETEIEELEQEKPAEMPEIDMMAAYRNPQIIGFMWTDMCSAVVLNILLAVASGIGLLAAKAWARKLALWTAAIKIVRLIGVYGYAIAVVVPIYSKIMSDMMEKFTTALPRRPGTPPMPPMGQMFGTFYGVAMSAGAILMIVVGSIYPIVVLWVLSRPKVKAACGELPAARPAELP